MGNGIGMGQGDEVVMGLLPEVDVRVVAVLATQTAREAAQRHRTRTAASVILGESLTAAALLAALQLQKSGAKVNLQLECDGPLRGLFAEGDAEGTVRGYVKNPLCDLEGEPGRYRWRPAFGNGGYLSVLRDAGKGEYQRSAVELEAFEVARDMERYFAASEQIPTSVGLVTLTGGEPLLQAVGGFLIQALPGAKPATLTRLSELMRGDALADALRAEGENPTALGFLQRVCGAEAEGLEVMSRYPLRWHCPCSKERVTRALLTLGAAELRDMVEKDGKAEASCHFCNEEYLVSGEELGALVSQLEGGAR